MTPHDRHRSPIIYGASRIIIIRAGISIIINRTPSSENRPISRLVRIIDDDGENETRVGGNNASIVVCDIMVIRENSGPEEAEKPLLLCVSLGWQLVIIGT